MRHPLGAFVKEQANFLLLGATALLLRLCLAPYGTLQSPDMNNLIAWSDHIAGHGPWGFYDSIWSSSSPGILYILLALGFMRIGFGVESPTALVTLFKLPAIVADVACGALIWAAVRRFDGRGALVAACAYWFNPAVFGTSALWGQMEGVGALLALASVALVHRPVFSAAALGCAALVKLQTGIVFPIAALMWWRRLGLREAAKAALAALGIFVVGFWPFSGGRPLFEFIAERLVGEGGQIPVVSGNAFNLWALTIGLWRPDAGWPRAAGIGITILACAAALRLWWKLERADSDDAPPMRYLAAAILLLASFLFMTRMHERDLLPAFAPMAVAAAGLPLLWTAYAALSGAYVAGLRFSFVWITEKYRWILADGLVRAVSALNLLLFAGLVWALHARRRLATKARAAYGAMREKLKDLRPPQVEWIERRRRLVLAGILLFAAATRLYGIAYPPGFYFDEVYHAYTAREMLGGNAGAWMWNSAPEPGHAFDWVQPPLAKVLMATSMAVCGVHPVGWRLPGALLGVGAAAFVYLLGAALFKNRTVGLLAAALFALDGLPLTLSRIGTNDSVFLFFTLGTFHFFLTDRYRWSAAFLGMAAATKLSFVWLPPALLALMLLYRKEWSRRLLWFAAVPPLIYLATYIPFFAAGHTSAEWFELHNQMVRYHVGLRDTHPFSSSWWTWPLMLKSVWLHTWTQDGLTRNIYLHGNPVLFWGGVPAVLFLAAVAASARSRELWAALILYAGLFVPWSFSPRVMFLYHYLPSFAFLCLILAWVLLCHPRARRALPVFGLLVVAAFLLLYPRWIGAALSDSTHALYHRWLPG